MSWKKLFIFVCIPAFVVGLTGCLKDNAYMDVSNTAPLIEFGLSPANGDYGPFAFEGDTAGSPVADTAVGLVIASPQVLNKAYTITVSVDTAQLGAFNSANGTSYTLLPAGLYSMPGNSVTIPAGHRIGRLAISVNLPAFPATHTYALPLTITDGGGLLISGNSNQFMWLFSR
ncbi:MAG TPA: DUF1735 domain-containing protein [Puia sp.]|nr:DUF1735 domain-containing protein [Puia sp.]